MDNTYPDDFFLLTRQIRLRKLDKMLTDLAIISNPHTTDPKVFAEELLKQQRFMVKEDPSPQIDRTGLDSLKSKLSESKMIKVKGYN